MEHRARRDSAADDSAVRPADDAGPLRDALRPRGPVRFGLEVTETPDRVCVRIWGEIDALTTPRLAAELNAVVYQSTDDVIVDLRKAEFMDSAGLQILLGIQRRLNNASRELTVVCDEGPVRRLIEMTRLTEVLGLTWGRDSDLSDS